MSPERPRRSHRLCPGCERPAFTRRYFLRRSSMGFGWLAFAGLANQGAWAATRNKQPHFAARARRVPRLGTQAIELGLERTHLGRQ